MTKPTGTACNWNQINLGDFTGWELQPKLHTLEDESISRRKFSHPEKLKKLNLWVNLFSFDTF